MREWTSQEPMLSHLYRKHAGCQILAICPDGTSPKEPPATVRQRNVSSYDYIIQAGILPDVEGDPDMIADRLAEAISAIYAPTAPRGGVR